MNLTLDGRVALVTGANGGLGAHFAETLANAGAKVALCARRVDTLADVATRIRDSGGTAHEVALDVTRRDSVVSAFENAAPPTWSFWRVRANQGTYYSAAYEDGDKSVSLFASSDGHAWTKGAQIYGIAVDTPLETELVFMPSGRMLAIMRTDGNDIEISGDKGRLRTKICWAMPSQNAPPGGYDAFTCPDEFMGQRLDGPLAFWWKSRLFIVARKHLGADGRKRTALFEITGTFEGGPLAIKEWGELPSAGDTSYAGVATIDENKVLLTWYSGDLAVDETWLPGMFSATDIWQATIDLSKLR